MSSLIVLLPSSDVLTARGWEAVPLRFALLGRGNEPVRSGCERFETLPKAGTTTLVVAARDTLLLKAVLPPVTGQRMRRLLPNVVEEHLIQDAQGCHIAVDPVSLAGGERCLAVIDREWFADVIARFSGAGHRKLRAVPLLHCIPSNQIDAGPSEVDETAAAVATSVPLKSLPAHGPDDAAEAGDVAIETPSSMVIDTSFEASHASAAALVVRWPRIEVPVSSDKEADVWVDLALRQGMLGFGMSVNAAQLPTTLIELARRQPLTVHVLGDAHESAGRFDDLSSMETGTAPPQLLPLTELARRAIQCRFNLCQFEFTNAGRGEGSSGGRRHWRLTVGLVAASMIVSLVAVNVQWWQLRKRRDALEAQMTQMVKTAFPGIPVVLDPHEQMALDLKRLRGTTGDLRDDDYLALSAGLARALGTIASTSINELSYSNGALEVAFKAGTQIDADGFRQRLRAQSLSAEENDGKWTLKPVPSRPL